MFVSGNEAKKNGLENDIIQGNRRGRAEISNVGEQTGEECLGPSQVNGRIMRHM